MKVNNERRLFSRILADSLMIAGETVFILKELKK